MTSSRELWQSVVRKVKYVSVNEFDYNIHISLRNNFLYVETPKVACSTLKLTLARIELDDENYFREDIHDRNVSPLLRASQVGDFEKFLDRKNLLKFCFVRNPYERLLSCYLNKVRGGDKSILWGLFCQLGLDQTNFGQEIGFETFVNAIEDMPISMMNAHWRPQYYQTFQDAIEFDYVGKLEKFEDDLREIGDRISKDFLKYYKSWSIHKTGSRHCLTEYYTKAMQEKVYKIYEIDFKKFGYKESLPVA